MFRVVHGSEWAVNNRRSCRLTSGNRKLAKISRTPTVNKQGARRWPQQDRIKDKESELTLAGAKSFAGDAHNRRMDAIMVVETTQ